MQAGGSFATLEMAQETQREFDARVFAILIDRRLLHSVWRMPAQRQTNTLSLLAGQLRQSVHQHERCSNAFELPSQGFSHHARRVRDISSDFLLLFHIFFQRKFDSKKDILLQCLHHFPNSNNQEIISI